MINNLFAVATTGTTAADVPTGTPAMKVFGIIVLILVLIGLIFVTITWAMSQTQKEGQNSKKKEKNSTPEEPSIIEDELDINELEKAFSAELEDESDVAVEPETKVEEDDLSSFFKPKTTTVDDEAQTVEAEQKPETEEGAFWNIPDNAIITDSTGAKYRFYDYHKGDRTKLWGLASSDEMKLISLEDIIKFESEDHKFSTVKLSKGLLLIEGSKLWFVDSLTAKTVQAKSVLNDKLRFETLPEGKIAENGQVLGEIISSKVDYMSGSPAFFFQDENGTPRRMNLKGIKLLEIASKKGNYTLERVVDTDLLCISSLTGLIVLNVENGAIIAKA